MIAKKNPKVDLNKNSGLYFSIGLAFMLFITWRALELKSYDEIEVAQITVGEDFTPEESIPIIELAPPPPPPPPSAPITLIEVIEDSEDVEETITQSTEFNKEEVIPDVIRAEDVKVAEEEEDVVVPFHVIEDVPIFPGCENASNKRDCFSDKMQEHVKNNFKYPDIAAEMGIEGKVFVTFVINKKGLVDNVKLRGPDRNLEMEAERIIRLVPQMTPGKQRGKPVNVPYSIPITFKLRY